MCEADSIRILTALQFGRMQVESRQGQLNFPLASSSTMDVGPTQLPIQYESGLLL
jgi:hypothetical protein